MKPLDEPTSSFSAMEQDIQSESTTGARQPGQTVLPCEANKKQRLRMVVRDAGFKAEVGLPYRLEAGTTRLEGKIGTDGVIDHLLPAAEERATLTLWEDEARESEPRVLQLRLKKLNPVTVPPGVRQRLINLGFDPGPASAPEEKLKKALAEFQGTFGLEPTGVLDPDSERTLEQVYAARKEGLEDAGGWRPAGGAFAGKKSAR
ncbi:peptidoglycan-binding protein [Pyxidicoccus parkwayensis]|uniref:Peptidoglycan-binding protein n=1 Tax=Pyxidicoccus parkwayensis TaxID=2813578 RepID=A0ABX7NNG8_9BACT|nr:peptidoglycan-binding domain-containing protein [Pyxidicoccus parkwaysis]QSQ19120.1 peptidoglycan-binding protein [Pyxidicoccus parkwaysis]